MNLDNLISKYVDGELNIDEDLILRELIANDKNAKDSFDAEINLHYLLKNDANSIKLPIEFENLTSEILDNQIKENDSLDIEFELRDALEADSKSIALPLDLETQTEDMMFEKFYKSQIINSDFELTQKLKADSNTIVLPLELETETENKILMGISQLNPTINMIDSVRKWNYKLSYYSMVASLLLFFTVYNIDDSFRGYFNSNSDKQTAVNSVNVKQNSKLNRIKKVKTNSNKIENRIDILEIKSHDFSNEVIVNESLVPFQVADEIANNKPLLNENTFETQGIQKNNPTVEIIQNSNNYQNNTLINENNFNFKTTPNNIKDIEFTTILGNSQFTEKLDNIKNLTSQKYAQSIAYFIDENQKLGFEIGVTEYNYLARTTIKVPINDIMNSKGNTRILQPDGTNERYINIDVDASKNTSSYWGTMFYERKLFNVDNFDITTRVGLGASINGAIVFDRLVARYKLFNLVYLNAGIEGTLSTLDLETMNYYNTKMNKSLSFVYGFQIKF